MGVAKWNISMSVYISCAKVKCGDTEQKFIYFSVMYENIYFLKTLWRNFVARYLFITLCIAYVAVWYVETELVFKKVLSNKFFDVGCDI